MNIEWIDPTRELPDVAIGEVRIVLIKTKLKHDRDGRIRECRYCGGDLVYDDDDRKFVVDIGFDYGNRTSIVDVSSAAYTETVVGWCYMDE